MRTVPLRTVSVSDVKLLTPPLSSHLSHALAFHEWTHLLPLLQNGRGDLEPLFYKKANIPGKPLTGFPSHLHLYINKTSCPNTTYSHSYAWTLFKRTVYCSCGPQSSNSLYITKYVCAYFAFGAQEISIFFNLVFIALQLKISHMVASHFFFTIKFRFLSQEIVLKNNLPESVTQHHTASVTGTIAQELWVHLGANPQDDHLGQRNSFKTQEQWSLLLLPILLLDCSWDKSADFHSFI